MIHNKIILEQIECDKHNIQELLNMLKLSQTQNEYNKISSLIKTLVKDISKQKSELINNIYETTHKTKLPLFEVELPELDINYHELTSFFGKI